MANEGLFFAFCILVWSLRKLLCILYFQYVLVGANHVSGAQHTDSTVLDEGQPHNCHDKQILSYDDVVLTVEVALSDGPS